MSFAAISAAISVVLGLATMAFAALWWRERSAAARRHVQGGAPDVAALFALRAEPGPPLGPRQQEVLAQMSQALPGHAVLARMTLSNFLSVSPAQQAQWATLVGQLHVDLLVCDTQGRPALALDLAAASEPAKATQLRRQKMRVIESAGITALSLSASEPLDIDAIRQLLQGQGPQSRPRATPALPKGTQRDGGKMAEAIPVAEAVEMSAEDLPEFAPTTIFRPDEAVLPPKS